MSLTCITSKLLWDAHIKQSKSQIKKTIYYTPKISFNSVDPLKLRFLLSNKNLIEVKYDKAKNIERI